MRNCITKSGAKDEIHLNSLLGKRLKELRKESVYSNQETFAYDAEISRDLYGKY